MMLRARQAVCAPLLVCSIAALSVAACGDDGGGGSASQGSAATAMGSTSGTGGGSGTTAGTGGSATADGSGGGTGGASATTGGPVTTGPATTGPATTGPATTEPATTAMGSTGADTTTGGDPGVVRFVVLGDTGEGNEDQFAVAQAIVEICAQKGCDFAVLTGDNFYDSGVSGVDDPQWQSKFEEPYMDFTFPVYAVLGNHDYGGNGIGVDFDFNKDEYQVQYTQKSELWRMPDSYYSFKQGHAEFWGLDTNEVMTDPLNGDSDPQKQWLKDQLAKSTATWKIAFGHHPYISNGDHGNAGSYENIEGIPLPFVTGESVKAFMEDAVCGKVDVYICGHDHNLQWLEATCGTEFIVSGAGSKAEDLPGSNPAHFQHNMEGFLWVELMGDAFTGVFYDKTGAELFSRSITK